MRPLKTEVPDDLLQDGRDLRAAPPLVLASLMRSRTTFHDPAKATVRSILDDDELDDHRDRHPLSSALPLIRSLLAVPAKEHGLIMAVGDEAGRLLWVEGDSGTRDKAETMAFLPGADWSESSVGTSAPGIAIATGAAVQVSREQHFAPQVTEFSCSAVPLTHPGTGERIGFLDMTGGERAVDSLILPYLRSTASAVQAHLSALHLAAQAETLKRSQAPRRATAPRRPAPRAPGARLLMTGNSPARLATPAGETTLSRRHAELLAVLARTGTGMDVAELAEAVYPSAVSHVTVRAEMTRLRKVLEGAGAADPVVLTSRPYRLSGLRVDALEVEALLGRGAHRQALAEYAGPLLPTSEAPQIVAWRQELAATLREAVLSDASVETLLEYLRRPEAADDAEVWTLALKLLPARSPKRAAVLAHLESLEDSLDD